MKDVMGIIFTSKDDYALRELTSRRCVTAIPVAARYRLVDFLMSNMVNSGVRNVGVLMQGNYSSLMDHISGGKEWDLHTRNNGLFILPPVNAQSDGGYQGSIDALKANVGYLRKSAQEMALVVGGNIIYNTRYDGMFEMHVKTHADITVMYTKVDPLTFDYSGSSKNDRSFVNVAPDGTITDIEVNPNLITYPNVLMDVLLIKRTLLMQLIDTAAAHGYHHVNMDILRRIIIEKSMKVVGYRFDGYCRRIETIKSYFNMNMDLLKPEVRSELFEKNPVFTKTRDDPPARYMPGAKVINSIIADGCVIEGTVENSVIFRGTRIGKGAHIKDSIIMQDGYIGQNCELENTILDKDVTILAGGRVVGHKQYPIVLGKNITL